MTSEQIQFEQIDLLRAEVKRLNEEAVAHKARIAQLEEQLKKQYERLTSCPCGGTIIGGCSRCG